MIDAAAKLVEIETKLAEKIDKLRTREALQLAAGFSAELFQFSLRLLADSPDFADRQFIHEGVHLFWHHLKLAVRLVYFARDFRDQFVRTDSRRRCELRFAKNRAADHLCKRRWCAGMRGYIQIRFVERKGFNQRRETMQDSTDDRCFTPINIEARRQHNQVRATLQRHERRH